MVDTVTELQVVESLQPNEASIERAPTSIVRAVEPLPPSSSINVNLP